MDLFRLCKRRVVFAVLLFPSLFLSAGGSTDAAGTPTATALSNSLQSLALQPADLPSGFEQGGHYQSNEAAARSYPGGLEEIERRGRIGSYETDAVSRPFPWQASVVSEVIAYRDSAGAGWEFHRQQAEANRAIGSQHRLNAPDVRRIGNVRIALGKAERMTRGTIIVNGRRRHGTLVSYDVVFRRARYVARVALDDIMGHLHAATILRLARVIDRRLQTQS